MKTLERLKHNRDLVQNAEEQSPFIDDMDAAIAEIEQLQRDNDSLMPVLKNLSDMLHCAIPGLCQRDISSRENTVVTPPTTVENKRTSNKMRDPRISF